MAVDVAVDVDVDMVDPLRKARHGAAVEVVALRLLHKSCAKGTKSCQDARRAPSLGRMDGRCLGGLAMARMNL